MTDGRKSLATGLRGPFGLALAALLAAIGLYASRFWVWRLWEKDGLFGVGVLGRDGDIVRRQVREAANGLGLWELNAFDILIWAALAFLLLSLLQWLWSKAAGGGGD